MEITTFVENAGKDTAKAISIYLAEDSDVLDSSYTNKNNVYVGRLNPGESREATFYLDVDKGAESKVYPIRFDFTYSDLDDNKYTAQVEREFLVKEKPNLEVVGVAGEGKAGSSINLVVTLKNTGTEAAEAVDVRLVKDSSQPFSFDLRSNYIGELDVNETGQAVFKADIGREAEEKNHHLKLLVRAKGDSDKGDDNIYIFNRRATIKVAGKAPNLLMFLGLGFAVIAILGMLLYKRFYHRTLVDKTGDEESG